MVHGKHTQTSDPGSLARARRAALTGLRRKVGRSRPEGWQGLVGAIVALTIFLAIAAPQAQGSRVVWGGSQVCAGADPEGCTSEFALPTANGYRITVSGQMGATGDNVLLVVRGHDAAVSYRSRGTVTQHKIAAPFGHRGEISLHFHPSGKTRRLKLPEGCLRSEPAVVKARLGTFSGSVRFRGEADYTEVFAHRVKGGVGNPLAVDRELECETRPMDSRRLRARGVHLEAAGRSFGAIDFQAWARLGWVFRPTTNRLFSDRAPDAFTASLHESRERMLISRIVVAPGRASDFTFERSLGSARVIPPAPFSGSASFSRPNNGSTAWTGDLAVPLPGLGLVPLAGSSFVSRLADDRVFP
jgi:hypothetical protein